jgi:hypothetical protein
LKGFNYLKHRPVVIAREDSAYPSWLWSVLDDPSLDPTKRRLESLQTEDEIWENEECLKLMKQDQEANDVQAKLKKRRRRNRLAKKQSQIKERGSERPSQGNKSE